MTTPSTPTYTRQLATHVRLGKGGFIYTYAIERDGETVGELTIARSTREHDTHAAYSREGREFETRAEFVAAVEEWIAKRADA